METPTEFKILDSIPDLNNLKSFTDRYFSKRYITDIDGIKNNDIMIMFHSNRIALLSLAPSHFFFSKDQEYKLNFTVGKVDRLRNAVKGKSKKGGQLLNPKSVVCKIEYKDGTSFDVPCGMKGTLIEVNEELVNQPELLKQYPDADGYIAIILSSIAISEATKSELLTHDEYLEVLNRCETKDLE
ncbi:protein Abitram [Helicoverpa zea]|uniref:protein Abitram n=1 Tax=Helicoverpa zea TaxID=7113 RepID=UPI001F5A288F|nr:protein Abitram [Helicoverpa armigera]XP_047034557.1 protein Abitram [Helicoverpa zea]XP_047034558.1 protein Abitram [Helicoverpa zea]XP_047034559.1 protein Abitram [Helicoverpa zea]